MGCMEQRFAKRVAARPVLIEGTVNAVGRADEILIAGGGKLAGFCCRFQPAVILSGIFDRRMGEGGRHVVSGR